MASCLDIAPEQLCYIPCNFCNIVLAVSVPCSSLFDIVTVRCGHCTNLWSVNMAAAFQALSWQDVQVPNYNLYSCNGPDFQGDFGSSSSSSSSSKCENNKMEIRANTTMGTEERVVNRPPEKKQRVPSAYNQFIKEEIQRIKANNPEISHREAFSTAAKNWAHYPRIPFWSDVGNQQSNEAR
ncbi:axial regulator YABBY 5-like [Cucurbita moschata]|uniref:Axial regulator YABBY 5-like n=1 Tax=Cucurbita moschata TaxID=3662 RepID=A0A6J1HA48_CUCMO|nr:axial regulator YABBY 5-like [Cucurbita moschata]